MPPKNSFCKLERKNRSRKTRKRPRKLTRDYGLFLRSCRGFGGTHLRIQMTSSSDMMIDSLESRRFHFQRGKANFQKKSPSTVLFTSRGTARLCGISGIELIQSLLRTFPTPAAAARTLINKRIHVVDYFGSILFSRAALLLAILSILLASRSFSRSRSAALAASPPAPPLGAAADEDDVP